jgi:predicted AAA+ superfamily ATPase
LCIFLLILKTNYSSTKIFPVVALTGVRQVGKTTVLRKILPNYNYASLDLPSLAELAELEIETFLATYNAPLIVDEIQYAPNFFRHLKRFVDENRHQFGQFVLTGNQSLPLMQEVGESLAGRIAISELENLSLAEITNHKKTTLVSEILKLIITCGQFVELWRNEELPATLFYSSYLALI